MPLPKSLPVLLLLSTLLHACAPAKHVAGPVRQPLPSAHPTDRPGRFETMDTVRWTTPSNPRPPIKNDPGKPGNIPGRQPAGAGDTYHLALLLPFLTNKVDNNSVPDKSKLALQFYAGAKIALEQLSKDENVNLVVDVYDTKAEDADFQQILNDRRLGKSDVFIGPVRASHVALMADWIKQNHKILVSPESPNSEITRQNPDFIQMNPSLRSHCEAIADYVVNQGSQDVVTLVCKRKEADRLPYFQEYAAGIGKQPFIELIVANEIKDFEKTDLKSCFKPGKTAVFILPTWSSQDFVMAFFRKLKAIKGNNRVEVYGMPQWKNFESIEAEYLTGLNVHITSATSYDYTNPEIKAFQQKFYDATGTIPDDEGFNGYDVTLFTGKMLKKYGLSFPEHLPGETFKSFQGKFVIRPHWINPMPSADSAARSCDYLENRAVQILKFDKNGFVPVNGN
jgi:ABC-type branched-subunit amino acid transport system substrate-binding protein